MKHYINSDYQSPVTCVFEVHFGGILCTSKPFGTATTDDFAIGEDISDIF